MLAPSPLQQKQSVYQNALALHDARQLPRGTSQVSSDALALEHPLCWPCHLQRERDKRVGHTRILLCHALLASSIRAIATPPCTSNTSPSAILSTSVISISPDVPFRVT